MSKPATHVATSAPCETCHKSTTTLRRRGLQSYRRSRRAPAPLAITARPRSASRRPATSRRRNRATSCHKSTVTFTGAVMSHTGITSGCATCHGGQFAGGHEQARHARRDERAVRDLPQEHRPASPAPPSITPASHAAAPLATTAKLRSASQPITFRPRCLARTATRARPLLPGPP